MIMKEEVVMWVVYSFNGIKYAPVVVDVNGPKIPEPWESEISKIPLNNILGVVPSTMEVYLAKCIMEDGSEKYVGFIKDNMSINRILSNHPECRSKTRETWPIQ